MNYSSLYKSLLIVLLLNFTGINAFADTFSYSFTAKVWSAYGNQTLSNVTWTAAGTAGAFFGYDSNTPSRGQQFGSSNNPATTLSLTTSGIAGTVTMVKVNTSGASGITSTVSISVGATAFTSAGSSAPVISATATDYSFTGSSSGNIVISWSQTSSKALYIKSIDITYSAAINSVPVVSSGSPTGTIGSPFSYFISATNSPSSYALASGTLPAGLSLNTTTGEISGTPTAAGNTSVNVTATNSIGTSLPATITFNISKKTQTITFGPLNSKTNQDIPFDLTATASSALVVSFSSSNTSVATISGSTVTIHNVGTTTITASQGGDSNYDAATPVEQLLTVNEYVAPTMTITEVTVPVFTTDVDATGSQTINVAGVNLTNDVSLSITGTDAGQFVILPNSVSQSGGNAANTVVTLNYNPIAPGTHNATLNFTSAGATNVTMSLTGTAAWAQLATPVASDATGITPSGFTANWNTVVGATEYQLDVYTQTSSGTTASTVISENFNNFSSGTPDEGASSTDIASTLDMYTQTSGWTGSKVYHAGGSAKLGSSSVLGSLTTPAIDLSANGGNFNITFKSMAWNGDATSLKIYLNDVLINTLMGLNAATYTMSTFSIDLTGGTANSKIRIEGNVASHGRFFLDDLVISKAGSSVTTTPIPGSPFTVTGATSKVLNGLAGNTVYNYSVIAKNPNVTSATSNVVSVSTTLTGLTTSQIENIGISNGTIRLSAHAGETIEVFTMLGQKIMQKTAVEGLNSVSVSSHGVLLIRAGNRVAKVIM